MADNVVPMKWQQRCIRSKSGKLASNVFNAMTGLRLDPGLHDVFGYDQLARQIVMFREIGELTGTADPRQARDTDITDVQAYLQEAGLEQLSDKSVWHAVQRVAEDISFNPLQRYLERLQWDGVKRINVWLSSMLGAKNTQYTQRIGAMFLISMVARAFRPGCPADHVLILQGPQGILKSRACRVLGGEWYSDHLPSLRDSQEVSLFLRGKWLIEMPELAAMKSAASQEQLKSFITRTHEQARSKYGRVFEGEPRTFVIIGTTNSQFIFHDETGARRFWPVYVGAEAPINIDYLEESRDQLFAEAVQEFKDDAHWWPDGQVQAELIEAEQEARYETDVWEEPVAAILRGGTPTTISELMELLNVKVQDQRPPDAKRVAAIMARLGWFKDGARTAGKRLWRPRGGLGL